MIAICTTMCLLFRYNRVENKNITRKFKEKIKMANNQKLSVFLSLLLRHKPEEVGLEMDRHGWVSVNQLIANINKHGRYKIDMTILEEIVATDNKGRYRFNDTKTQIKACQGHSVPGVEPELTYGEPPKRLYHGTNTEALGKIEHSGHISKMKRHAVHLYEEEAKVWQSAERWSGKTPVVIEIDAEQMHKDGFVFGKSDNDVWCVDDVPVKYIVDRIYIKM
jgi:putative RNA 2'-phosphotransferase